MLSNHQPLQSWFQKKLSDVEKRLEKTETELTNAFTRHGLKEPEDDALKQVKQSLCTPFTSEIKSDVDIDSYPLEFLTKELDDLLKNQTSKDPKPDEISKFFAKVRIHIADATENTSLEKFTHKNVRELIKQKLTTSSGMENLDQPMNNYQNARIQYLTLLIAYKNLKKTLADVADLRKKYPHCYVDFYQLIRHEVCKRKTKMGGLRKDTPLTAIKNPTSKTQSIYELFAASMIHSVYAEALKATGLVQTVDLHISPIKRAYQTAFYAVFRGDIPDSTVVSRLYTETKHGIRVSLRRACVTYTTITQ